MATGQTCYHCHFCFYIKNYERNDITEVISKKNKIALASKKQKKEVEGNKNLKNTIQAPVVHCQFVPRELWTFGSHVSEHHRQIQGCEATEVLLEYIYLLDRMVYG